MGVYRVAEVCPNGHVSTSAADEHPDLREKFCSKCGEETITKCPTCHSSIRGYYYVENFFTLGSVYQPPAHCHNCGSAFLGRNESWLARLNTWKRVLIYPPKKSSSSELTLSS